MLSNLFRRGVPGPDYAKARIRKFEKRIIKGQKNRVAEFRRKGIIEGGKGLPPPDDKGVSIREKEIKSEYEQEIDQIKKLGETLESYHANFAAAREERLFLEHQIKSNYALDEQALKKEYGRVKESFERYEKNHQEELDNVKRDYEEAKEKWETQCKIKGRHYLHSRIPRKIYYAMMWFIFLGEIPLNSLVFAIFRENLLMTYLIASVIAALLPLAAHFSGVWLKQHGDEEGIERKDVRKACVLIVIVISGLGAIGVVRYLYLFQSVGEDTLASSIAFFLINVVIFSIAIVASMFSHDESLEFEMRYYDFQQLRKTYREKQDSVEKSIARERIKLDAAAKDHDRALSDKRRAYNEQRRVVDSKSIALMSAHDSLLEDLRGLEDLIYHLYCQAIYEYRATNRETRKLPAPLSFNNDPLLFPFHFKQMEELRQQYQRDYEVLTEVTKIEETLH